MKFRESLFQGEIAHMDNHLQAVRELTEHMLEWKRSMKLRENEVKQQGERFLTTYSVSDSRTPDKSQDALEQLQMGENSIEYLFANFRLTKNAPMNRDRRPLLI